MTSRWRHVYEMLNNISAHIWERGQFGWLWTSWARGFTRDGDNVDR